MSPSSVARSSRSLLDCLVWNVSPPSSIRGLTSGDKAGDRETTTRPISRARSLQRARRHRDGDEVVALERGEDRDHGLVRSDFGRVLPRDAATLGSDALVFVGLRFRPVVIELDGRLLLIEWNDELHNRQGARFARGHRVGAGRERYPNVTGVGRRSAATR